MAWRGREDDDHRSYPRLSRHGVRPPAPTTGHSSATPVRHPYEAL